ncbi:condensation domain-containing protein, partial [Bacillus altitudinis]|uniref:condensation domain-containing protein n=1 Tax=Bacillus altitudinis TaxID=293387 RepID=UPI001F21EE1F
MNGVRVWEKEEEAVEGKFDLRVGVFEEEDEVGLGFEYGGGVFKKSRIEGWSEYFEGMIEEMVGKLNEWISSISMLRKEEE